MAKNIPEFRMLGERGSPSARHAADQEYQRLLHVYLDALSEAYPDMEWSIKPSVPLAANDAVSCRVPSATGVWFIAATPSLDGWARVDVTLYDEEGQAWCKQWLGDNHDAPATLNEVLKQWGAVWTERHRKSVWLQEQIKWAKSEVELARDEVALREAYVAHLQDLCDQAEANEAEKT